MNKILYGLIIIFFTASYSWSQIDLMTKRSSGIVRYLGLIKVYDASLYTYKSVPGENILEPDISKCLKLVYNVSLTSDNLIEGANTVLRRQHEPAVLSSITPLIEELHRAYKSVQEGDSYSLCYDAASNTTSLRLNDKLLTSIVSSDFSSIYFGIWLGQQNPISESLRNDLLSALDEHSPKAVMK